MRRITIEASNERYIKERNNLSEKVKGMIRFLDCNVANPLDSLSFCTRDRSNRFDIFHREINIDDVFHLRIGKRSIQQFTRNC